MDKIKFYIFFIVRNVNLLTGVSDRCEGRGNPKRTEKCVRGVSDGRNFTRRGYLPDHDTRYAFGYPTY